MALDKLNKLQKDLDKVVAQKESGKVTFEAVDEDVAVSTPEVEKKEEIATPVMQANTNSSLMADAQRTKEILEKYPKVKFVVPLYEGEIAGKATESVTINGYRLTIKKGVMVDLPEPMVRLLADHYQINMGNLGAEADSMRLDRSESTQRALV